MKPEPSAATSRPVCGVPRFSKKRFKSSSNGVEDWSLSSADWSVCAAASLVICAEMLTTAGNTRCTSGFRLGSATGVSFCTCAVMFLSVPLVCALASAGISASVSAAAAPISVDRNETGGAPVSRCWPNGI